MGLLSKWSILIFRNCVYLISRYTIFRYTFLCLTSWVSVSQNALLYEETRNDQLHLVEFFKIPTKFQDIENCNDDEIEMKIISIFQKCSDINFKTKFERRLEKHCKQIRYTRQFLLDCGKSPLCDRFPPNWEIVVLENPDVIKKVRQVRSGVKISLRNFETCPTHKKLFPKVNAKIMRFFKIQSWPFAYIRLLNNP